MAYVYMPAEDSFLIKKWVLRYAKGRVLDVGTGSGIQAITASRHAESVIAVDVNPAAIKAVRERAKKLGIINIDARVSYLFNAIKPGEKFNLIIFNPPYLPKDAREGEGMHVRATTGGKHGYELIIEFIHQVRKYLRPEGKVLLLISSLSRPKMIYSEIMRAGMPFKVIDKLRIAFEELQVLLISRGD